MEMGYIRIDKFKYALYNYVLITCLSNIYLYISTKQSIEKVSSKAGNELDKNWIFSLR